MASRKARLCKSANEYSGNFCNKDDRLWKQYEILTDLHKYYLDLLFKAVAALNTIIGAYVAFILFKIKEVPVLAFLFPAFLSIGASLVFFIAIPRAVEFNLKMIKLVQKLEIGVGPHITLTINSCMVFALFYLLASIGFGLISFGCISIEPNS